MQKLTHHEQTMGRMQERRQAYLAIVAIVAHCVVGPDEALAGGTSADLPTSDLRVSVLSDPESVARGEARFSALCVYCHGHGGVGGKAKKLRGRQLETDYVFETITNGKKRGSLNMPPWRSLPERARWELVAYIQSLSGNGK